MRNLNLYNKLEMKFILVFVVFAFVIGEHVRDMRTGFGDDDDFMSWYQPMEPWKNEESDRSGKANNQVQ